MAHLQPGDELGVDEAVRHQHFRPLANPERQGTGLTRLIGAIENPLAMVRAQAAPVAGEGGVGALPAGDRVQGLHLAWFPFALLSAGFRRRRGGGGGAEQH